MDKLQRALRRVGLVQDLSDQPVLQQVAEEPERSQNVNERFALVATVKGCI
jgi:hypothetical protein